jgi:predicted dehydrogenase
VKVGVVGLGYWGPNLARNFDALAGVELAWLCDGREEIRDKFAAIYRQARLTGDIEELLADPTLDAIDLATPVPTHADLAVRVLDAGKHCFVEKPLALTVADAERAVEAAQRAGKVLMVGHLLQYHPGVNKLKELVDDGVLGDIHYIYGNRLNLGQVRTEENALWSLGAHDISVLLHLAGNEEPYEFSARGESYMTPGVEDVVFAFMRFPSGMTAHLHLSWLDPHKERRFTVVGSKKMATFDDMDLERKVTIYDKQVGDDFKAVTGDIVSPKVVGGEPLRVECQHFLDSIANGTPPVSDGQSGLRVVRVLERLQEELELNRREVPQHG